MIEFLDAMKGGWRLHMDALNASGKSYPLDRRGFLTDPWQWDLDFAAAMAQRLGQAGQLTLLQLKVVLFVHRHFMRQGEVARIYSTCHACGLSLSRLRDLFPWGYQRGVCRLAGIAYDVIDDSHHALTYETVHRRNPSLHDGSSEHLPRSSGLS